MEPSPNGELITVKIFNDSFEANIAQIKLKEHEIESFLEEENAIGLNPIGGTELKVFSSDLQKAEEILSKPD